MYCLRCYCISVGPTMPTKWHTRVTMSFNSHDSMWNHYSWLFFVIFFYFGEVIASTVWCFFCAITWLKKSVANKYKHRKMSIIQMKNVALTSMDLNGCRQVSRIKVRRWPLSVCVCVCIWWRLCKQFFSTSIYRKCTLVD